MKTKLLCLLAAVIAFDFLVTLIGQPAVYWVHPRTADEGNPVFRWFMFQGAPIYLLFIVAYIAGVILLVRSLSRQAALVTGLVFLLSHYFAASTWLSFHFHLNMAGPAVYALLLSLAAIWILRPGDVNGCCESGR